MDAIMAGDGIWLILRGLGTTVAITLLSLFFGTLLGGGIYAMTLSRHRWVREVAKWWKVIVRGTPMLVLLLIIFTVLLGSRQGLLAAVLAFSINFSNFSASLFQSSIASVGAGQVEAGQALGLSRWQVFRCIVAPQAIANALPSFRYQAMTILKGTSIVGYVAVQDLTQATKIVAGGLGYNLLPLLMATGVYFLLAWLLNKLIDAVTKSLITRWQ